MSGTAREAERAQELRRKAAEGDKAAEHTLQEGEGSTVEKAKVHDVGKAPAPTPETGQNTSGSPRDE